MKLDKECKSCLYNSQLKKVEREQSDGRRLKLFKDGVRALCKEPPADYCAPLLMRDIDAIHRKIFGCGIDYSREKKMFNQKLLTLEEELSNRIFSSAKPLKEALKFAMASNYIDFARLCELDESSISVVIAAAEKAEVNPQNLERFETALANSRSLLYLHDNCGEIVLDKILIKLIKRLKPSMQITSVVRGKPIINDVTAEDAKQVGLEKYARVIDNGTNVPGTYLKEISSELKNLLRTSEVIISKGLGNLETLYGEGYKIFYAFNCKCAHIAQRFGAKLWESVFVYE